MGKSRRNVGFGVLLCLTMISMLSVFHMSRTDTLYHVYEDSPDTHDNYYKSKSNHTIFCWLMVTESILLTKTVHVNATWGRRCDHIVFLGDVDNPGLQVVGLGTPRENRTHLTSKRDLAMEYLYQHHLEDADWFFKADSDSYVIIGNLRHYLSQYDPREPLVVGQMFRNHGGVVYPAGGGGYALSREALRVFGAGRRRAGECQTRTLDAAEEIHLARCLKELGVQAHNSLDDSGRTVFHQYNLTAHLSGNLPRTFYRRSVADVVHGIHNLSRTAVSFHYISPEDVYAMEYLLYHLVVHT